MMTTLQDNTKKVKQSESVKEDFVREYIDTRKKEHRIYSNKEVLQLPNVPMSHVHYKEWEARKNSSRALINYLSKKKKSLRILEVGCGNGWLSASLATLDHSHVTGIDVNYVELNQAKEVFNHLQNLHFINTTLDSSALSQQTFDVIVFAASLQYFASVGHVINTAQSLLERGGEMHILDTHFYKRLEKVVAKKRTSEYYSSIGSRTMSEYYYHHSLSDFSPYNYSILFKPTLIQRIVFRDPRPFYWIKVKGKD